MHFALLRDIATWLLIGGSAVGCLYLLYAGFAVHRFAARSCLRPAELPAISVLKPLCGEDPELYANLASLCRQDCRSWQIVFGVQDPNDPAIAVVRRLIEDFPEVDIELVIDGTRRGSNLKVANLQNMYSTASHDVIVIADSDMRVTPAYLTEVTAPLCDSATGLVTCLYRGLPAGGFWSALACMHINQGFLPQAVVADSIGAGSGCFGATMALRRSTLEAIGGFASVADVLADDHALGAAVRRVGLKLVLSPFVVDNVIDEPNLATLFRHELRWARTIWIIAPAGFVGSVVTQPVVLAGLALMLGAPPLAAATMLAVALACRLGMVQMVGRALGLAPVPVWQVVARDLLSFAVFVATFFNRTVTWRDRVFRIGPGGQLVLDGDKRA
jgi:ceramide glucosyltransferase